MSTLDLGFYGLAVREAVQQDVARLLNAKTKMQIALHIPDSAFTVVAPLGWASDSSTIYGVPVFRTADVNRPGLTVDPAALW